MISPAIVRLFAVTSLFSFVAANNPSQAMADDTFPDLEIVILVDESASLSKSDVSKEISAVTSLISRRELSGGQFSTRIAIAGFGSGANAVDEKCPLTNVGLGNIRELQSCADLVARRVTGQHTDFAQALAYASAVFRRSNDSKASRVVILLTDGKYDPSGSRSTTGLASSEFDALEQSLAALRTDGAQIWPLGFGQVSEEELGELAKKGATTRCPNGSPPYAVIASSESLDTYLLKILSATICRVINPPKPIPYDFPVHPFANLVTLTVRGASGEPEVLVRGSNRALCRGEWKRAVDESLSCIVTVAGTDTGVWRISADGSAADGPATVETSLSGRVDLRLTDCSPGRATVSVSRIDGTEIQWDTDGNISFPNLKLSNASDQQLLREFELSASEIKVVFDPKPNLEALKITLAANQDTFVWLTASTDQCQLVVTPTTVAGTSTTAPGNTEVPPVSTASDGGFPIFRAIIALAILAIIAWVLNRRLRPKFPVGTELRQRNVSANPSATWNTRANLDDRRAAAFTFDKNGWITESDSSDADLIVKRIRNRQTGDFLLIEPAKSSTDSTGHATKEAAHAFSNADDKRFQGIRVRNTFIRVDIPADSDDD